MIQKTKKENEYINLLITLLELVRINFNTIDLKTKYKLAETIREIKKELK